jgi:hypothetical protein
LRFQYQQPLQSYHGLHLRSIHNQHEIPVFQRTHSTSRQEDNFEDENDDFDLIDEDDEHLDFRHYLMKDPSSPDEDVPDAYAGDSADIEKTNLTTRLIKHALPRWMFIELVADDLRQQKRTRRRNKKNGKQSLSRSIALLPRHSQYRFLGWKRERRQAMSEGNSDRQKEIELLMWAAIEEISISSRQGPVGFIVNNSYGNNNNHHYRHQADSWRKQPSAVQAQSQAQSHIQSNTSQFRHQY